MKLSDISDPHNTFVSLAEKPGTFGQTIYNAAFRHLNLPYQYIPLKCHDIEHDIALIKDMGIRGASITMPYKQRVCDLVDGMTRDSLLTHSINTITNNGKLIGHNTDVVGARIILDNLLDDDVIDILGTGGMAHTFAYILSGKNVRMLERDAIAPSDATVVINATPMGMEGIAQTFSLSDYPNCRYYVESVIGDTAAVNNTKSKIVTTGSEIALAQITKQFEIYTGLYLDLRCFQKDSLFQEV